MGSVSLESFTDNLEGTPPAFGHGMLKLFSFEEGYVNLNHGSYGSLPNTVADACEKWSRRIESNPDKFMRLDMRGELDAVRHRLAPRVGAGLDEIVIVPSALHGVDTVLRNFDWNEGDVIIGMTTTYNSVERCIQYIHDLKPHPAISEFPLTFPTSHPAIINTFRFHVRKLRAHQNSTARPGQELKIVAVIDSLASNPGVLLPWKELVQICKEEGIWSVIDAAHSIGQEMDINLGEVQPDFWISNCHKWLFAKRGCAMLYIPKRNRHIIKSPFPTSYAYRTVPQDAKGEDIEVSNLLEQFEWTGTRDYAPWLSVHAALAFRSWLGGETAINTYCRDLAIRGGARLAEVMGTQLLDTSENSEFTLNMVNVALPLSDDVPNNGETDMFFKRKMLLEHHCFAAHYRHAGKWWTRVSAQIWNEISDFEHLGKAYLAVCKELEEMYKKEEPKGKEWTQKDDLNNEVGI